MSAAAPVGQDSLARLRGSPLPRILMVSHARGGGVQRHLEDLAALLQGHAEVLTLQPEGEHLCVRWLGHEPSWAAWVPAGEWERLVALLRSIGVDRVHYHHVDGWPPRIVELHRELGCAHDLTLHDYFPACLNYHFVDAAGRYRDCDPGCTRCLEGHRAPWAMGVHEWRATFHALLGSARRVIAPSADAARRIGAFFPGVAPVVWPHPEAADGFPRRPWRVLVPGAISPLKGLDLLQACVADASARGLPLHFVVLGFTGRPLAQWPEAPLSVAGEYREGTLPALIAHSGGDVVLFPAQCPETFSYTLSAALDSGLPIVATALGAFVDRLAQRPGATLVPWDAPATALNDALLAAAQARAPAKVAPPPRERMAPEEYRGLYLAGIERGAEAPAAAAPDPVWLVAPSRPQPVHPISFLFQDGVECGRSGPRAQLRRYAFDPDALYADADARFLEVVQALGDERKRAAGDAAAAATRTAQAEARAQAAEDTLRRLEGSASWRLTAPLRRVVRWLRRKA